MPVGKGKPGCGLITTGEDAPYIVVAGGVTDYWRTTSSVHIFMIARQKWTTGKVAKLEKIEARLLPASKTLVYK